MPTEEGKELIRKAIAHQVRPDTVRIEVLEMEPPGLWEAFWAALRGKRKPNGWVKLRATALVDGTPFIDMIDVENHWMQRGDHMDVTSLNLHITSEERPPGTPPSPAFI